MRAQALNTLTKNDITEVKGMKSPPQGVKLVLEAVCIMKDVRPVRGVEGGPKPCLVGVLSGVRECGLLTHARMRVLANPQVRMKDAQSGRMVDDYWEASKKMLMEDDFLNSLKSYDRDHIDAGIIKKIKVGVQGWGKRGKWGKNGQAAQGLMRACRAPPCPCPPQPALCRPRHPPLCAGLH